MRSDLRTPYERGYDDGRMDVYHTGYCRWFGDWSRIEEWLRGWRDGQRRLATVQAKQERARLTYREARRATAFKPRKTQQSRRWHYLVESGRIEQARLEFGCRQ